MANVATASLKQNINYNKLIKITFEEAAILVMIKVKIYVKFLTILVERKSTSILNNANLLKLKEKSDLQPLYNM